MSRVLYLPVKAVYFHQVVAGTKPEEFRLVTPFWRKRLEGQVYDFVELTLGYPAREDHSRRYRQPWRDYRVVTITHPHFGPAPVEVFAIRVSDWPLEFHTAKQ